MPTAPLNILLDPIIQQTLPQINLDCIAVSLNSIQNAVCDSYQLSIRY